MKAHAANDETVDEPPIREEAAARSSTLKDAQSLWHELHALAHDYLLLAALETRRVGESLVTMMVAGIMVAVFLNTAWLGLVAAAVQRLIENGMPVSNAILLAVAANLLVVLIFCVVIRRKARYLQFPATLHSLQPPSATQRPYTER